MNEKILKSKFDKFLDIQEDLNYNLSRWWSYTRLGSWWIDFQNGIGQLVKWRTVIYNQREWDYNGIYDLLELKIQLLKQGIETRDHHTDVQNAKRKLQ